MVLFPSAHQNEVLQKSLLAHNARTSLFGLSLTEENAKELIQYQHETLSELKRVEFGPGPLEGIIKAFCDSPYLNQDTYHETLAALQAYFYQLKDAVEQEMSDDDLIDAMRVLFDNNAHGETAYFDDVSLDTLKAALETINQDKDEDWSEYDTQESKEAAADELPETISDTTSRVKEAESFDRPTNEYADNFYNEQFDLYRKSFDYNSRIGGSSL